MTGVIWLIQVVHYPSFNWVDRARSVDFSAFHVNGITKVVAPAMLGELGTAVFFIFAPPLELPQGFAWLNFLSIALIWISTFLFSVPKHDRLKKGHDGPTVRALVRTNWPRTILWTLRCLGLVLLFGGMN
ncbi:MAG: hypothetical protein H6617_06315 [Bdellovibrionaceae bacterium]|nr:hypothetical protein [Bdellovibrionales bacterium]MCB9254279.1 hypothetical protein [Pseudobdellovibrionaceae bacterium]